MVRPPPSFSWRYIMQKAISKYWPVFVLPTLIAFIIGFIWPFIWGIYLSFQRFTTVSKTTFVGIQNYISVFQDSTFLHAFGFTAAFTVVSTVLINVCAFAIALVLTRGIKGTNLFRTVFFMPNLIGGILLGYIWQILLNGVLANLQKPLLALDAKVRLHRSGHPDVLAADRLHDDHLCGRPAERPRRPHRSRQDRRCQRPGDPVQDQDPHGHAQRYHLHLPDPDQQLQAV